MNRFATWKKTLSVPKQKLVDYAVNAVMYAGLYTIFTLLADDRPPTAARVVFAGIFFSLFLTSSKQPLNWKELRSIFSKKRTSEPL
jgi:hypothetical protein